MPIRLNLLAEAQAAEELRRRDPVKRVIWIACLLVALMLVWSSSLQLKAMLARSDLSRTEAQLAARTNAFQLVVESESKSADVRQKLAKLRQLAASRFLHGTLLNALQQTTVEGFQLVRLRTEQTYGYAEETPDRTNDTRVIRGKPASVTERIVLTLDAKDIGPNPGDRVKKFKEAVAGNPYFQTALDDPNQVQVRDLRPTQTDPEGRPFALFTLECRYPEKTR